MTSDDGDGGKMEAVLARAQAAIAELAKSYSTWAMADLDKCVELLKTARSDPALSTAKITELFGIAHNIKGQGTSFGYPMMTRIGHSLCSFTRSPREFAERDYAIIQAHLDALRLILAKGIKGDGGDAGQKLTLRLETLVKEAMG